MYNQLSSVALIILISSAYGNRQQQVNHVSSSSSSSFISSNMMTTTSSSVKPLVTQSSILLDEDFQNISARWDRSLNGETAVYEQSVEDGYNVMSNIISYCGPGICYRSEYQTIFKQRKSLFPSVNTEYWLGFSNRLPAHWRIPASTELYKFDIFQLHGGANYPIFSPPPNVALRVINGNYVINICGGSNVLYCQDHILAPINTGTWNHWVIHSILTPQTEGGTFQMWLNNTFVCDLKYLPTSFDDPKNVPYVKFGSYDLDWKLPNTTGVAPHFTWIQVDYRRMILGNKNATYESVYTGSPDSPTPPVLLDETFISLDYWRHSAERHIANDYSLASYPELGYNTLTFNMTNCSFATAVTPSRGIDSFAANFTTCPSPFLNLKPEYRLQSIQTTTSEYWLSFSNLIPAAWPMPPKGQPYEITLLTLRRNISVPSLPLLSLRLQAGQFLLFVCGNAEHNSSAITCVHESLGWITQDNWNDFVIHSRLSHTEPTGFVAAWRGNILMANLTNILTSCNDDNPPVLSVGLQILGSNVSNIPSYSYVGVIYKALRLGTASASYSSVYTGDGTSKLIFL